MKFSLLLLGAAVLFSAPSVRAGRTAGFTEKDRSWWSFQPVQNPAVPAVRTPGWVRNPVDNFVLARLEQHQLAPAPEASRPALVRRLFFDLLGLPPEREEVEAFVNDSAPDAWERLVDRVLASPRYGERQARLWLDLVRYADSDGYRADGFRPHAWRYRDYVIRSFNDDKPYDRFVREQLAGDELYPEDPDALTATGYLRQGIYEYNNRDAAGQWNLILNDLTDTTADVFLGLGLQCARCHDHKFDPLLQEDYYRLQAFFAPMHPGTGLPAALARIPEDGNSRKSQWEIATEPVRMELDALRAPEMEEARLRIIRLFPPESQAILEKPESERSPHEQQIAALVQRQIQYEWDNLDAKIKGSAKESLVRLRKTLTEFDSLKPPEPAMADLASDIGPVAPPVLIPRRESEGDILPGFPTLLSPGTAAVRPLPHSTGRRSSLAEWLTRPENPLTARVIVNRLWQQHFGKGLSATTSDLGTLGDPPSHPELLDWLSTEFLRGGWSLKKIHRLLLTSAAWKQGHLSSVAADGERRDPENRLLWRWATRRLEAEQIRDAIFYASGELDLSAGGPGVDSSKPRRSIFVKVLRNVRDPLMDIFDVPQHFQSTPVRDTTTTPTQSLFLANSRFMEERSEAMAKDLILLTGLADQVESAWWRIAGRSPTTDEREESLAFLAAAEGQAESAGRDPFVSEPMPQRNGQAGALTPGSMQERLVADAPRLPAASFSVEAVALLHSVYPDGSLRPIAGQWAEKGEESGWMLAVTGQKSRRQPQMLVLMLSGTDREGKPVQEPVFSDLTMQLDRSYFVAAGFEPADGEKTGTVTFFLKDLANDDEPMRSATVPHPVSSLAPPDGPLFIGAANSGKTSLWDGLIDEIRLSRGVLGEKSLAITRPEPGAETMACWQFEPGSFREDRVSGKNSIRMPEPATDSSPAQQSLADLCHVLLNSSALLYVE